VDLELVDLERNLRATVDRAVVARVEDLAGRSKR
jgi:hypothetical protein